MDEYIEQRLPIDITLDTEKDHIYSGLCVKSDRYVFIIINFDADIGEFNGFTVFRDKDVVAYRLWDDDDKSELKNDNSGSFRPLVDLGKMNTIYSSLKEASKQGLISFFTGLYDKECYVGELQAVDRRDATFRLISTEGEWLGIKILPIKEISHFGFASTYEKALNLNTQQEPEPAG